MERRALIAVIISVAILVLYQEVVLKRLYTPGPLPPQLGEAPTAAPGTGERSAPPAAPGPPEEAAEAPSVDGVDVTVDTDLCHAVCTTAGARLKSLQLKGYQTSVGPDSPPLQLVQYPVEGKLPLGVALRGSQTLSDAAVL